MRVKDYQRDRSGRMISICVVLGAAFFTICACVVETRDAEWGKYNLAQLRINEIVDALKTFRQDLGRYPTVEEGLGALIARPKNLPQWNGPYLVRKEALTDPWSRGYVYQCQNECRGFVVMSLGADGLRGGTGWNADIVRQEAL